MYGARAKVCFGPAPLNVVLPSRAPLGFASVRVEGGAARGARGGARRTRRARGDSWAQPPPPPVAPIRPIHSIRPRSEGRLAGHRKPRNPETPLVLCTTRRTMPHTDPWWPLMMAPGLLACSRGEPNATGRRDPIDSPRCRANRDRGLHPACIIRGPRLWPRQGIRRPSSISFPGGDQPGFTFDCHYKRRRPWPSRSRTSAHPRRRSLRRDARPTGTASARGYLRAARSRLVAAAPRGILQAARPSRRLGRRAGERANGKDALHRSAAPPFLLSNHGGQHEALPPGGGRGRR